MIETIVMVGVIWNALLQTYWLFWSKKIHERKHLTDEEEIEKYDQLKMHFENEFNKLKREVEWREFSTTSKKDGRPKPSDFIVKPQPGDSWSHPKKYNPDDITGDFDSFFSPVKDED